MGDLLAVASFGAKVLLPEQNKDSRVDCEAEHYWEDHTELLLA